MAKYTVEFRLWANVEVDAESFDEAFTKANKKWYCAEFEKQSGFKILEGESFFAESENGEIKYID